MIKNNIPYFEVSDKRLEEIYLTKDYMDDKMICSLRWINTRNEFSSHILKSLLHYQVRYWFSGEEKDLKPLALKQFLSLYPAKYLDESRLSRLIPNLGVYNPQNQFINLRSLFMSKKRYHAYLVKEIVENSEEPLRDKTIQCILIRKGIHLSLRTICNCRKLFNVPNYKGEPPYYYGEGIIFSDYIMLSRKYFNKIPSEAGVYELSILTKIDYPNQKSNVIYIGYSKNLRKRIANYSGNRLKNNRLNNYINNQDVFIRFCLVENCISVEKRLFRNFKKVYGSLPIANKIGA